MNGRITSETTPEGRLAAVARTISIRLKGTGKEADYADFRDGLRAYVHRELLLAQIAEARHVSGDALTVRVKELAIMLVEVNKEIELETHPA